MQAIRQTALLNKRELENATPPSASWHADYRDTAWIYCGGFPLDLSEGDVLTIFSQFGNPTHLNLIRDKETGKSKGFGFLKYEDQRSCDLAVDNLGGAEVLGRMLRVDHTRYKKKDDEDEDTHRVERLEAEMNGATKAASDTEDEGEGRRKRRKTLKEERELEEMLAIENGDGEEQDPMRDYLIQEKKEEVQRARDREERKERKHRHRDRQRDRDEGQEAESSHRHRHRHRDRSQDEEDGNRERRHRRREDDNDRKSKRREDDAADGEQRHRTRRRGDNIDLENARRRKHDEPANERSHRRRDSRSPSPDRHRHRRGRDRQSPRPRRRDESD